MSLEWGLLEAMSFQKISLNGLICQLQFEMTKPMIVLLSTQAVQISIIKGKLQSCILAYAERQIGLIAKLEQKFP